MGTSENLAAKHIFWSEVGTAAQEVSLWLSFDTLFDFYHLLLTEVLVRFVSLTREPGSLVSENFHWCLWACLYSRPNLTPRSFQAGFGFVRKNLRTAGIQFTNRLPQVCCVKITSELLQVICSNYYKWFVVSASILFSRTNFNLEGDGLALLGTSEPLQRWADSWERTCPADPILVWWFQFLYGLLQHGHQRICSTRTSSAGKTIEQVGDWQTRMDLLVKKSRIGIQLSATHNLRSSKHWCIDTKSTVDWFFVLALNDRTAAGVSGTQILHVRRNAL